MIFEFQAFLNMYFSGNLGSFKISDCRNFGTYPRGFQGRSSGCSGDTRCAKGVRCVPENDMAPTVAGSNLTIDTFELLYYIVSESLITYLDNVFFLFLM